MALPLIVLLAYPFAGWAAAAAGEVLFGAVMIAWPVGWIVLVLRATLAPCPRCGGRIPFFPASPSRACPTCKWPYRLEWKDP